MIEDPDFIDSHAPFDGEVVTDAPWKLPPAKAWEPKPLTWRERLHRWLGGAK